MFAAIRYEDWGGASAGIATLPDSPLKAVARAELFTARNSPRAELGPILSLLAEAPDLPQADQLQQLAIARGAVDAAGDLLPAPDDRPRRPRRAAAAPARSAASPPPTRCALALEPWSRPTTPLGAEAQLLAQAPYLSFEARAEAAQRVAFIYYVLGRDADVRRVADQWRAGATGEWGAQAAWVSGLAAWRMADYGGAAGRVRRSDAPRPAGANSPPPRPIGRRARRRPAAARATSSRCCRSRRARRKAFTACSRARRWA